jgi:hypothetical protein
LQVYYLAIIISHLPNPSFSYPWYQLPTWRERNYSIQLYRVSLRVLIAYPIVALMLLLFCKTSLPHFFDQAGSKYLQFEQEQFVSGHHADPDFDKHQPLR